jgi:hypothetical protein
MRECGLVDDTRRAYAILGLRQGTSLAEVRRRYLLLAKRWHPDRFVGESGATQTAEEQMRLFNGAYHTLVEALRQPSTPESTGVPGRRLSRDELERLVASMNAPGPIDDLLTSLGWVGSRVQAAWAAVFMVATSLRVSYLLATGQFVQLLRDLERSPTLVFPLVVLVILGVAECVRRFQLRKHEGAVLTENARRRLTRG